MSNLVKLRGSIVMPPKRSPESNDAKDCILQIGKYNDVVAWNLEMRDLTVVSIPF